MPKTIKMSVEEINTIVKMYTDGMSLRDIADSTKHCKAFISKVLKKEGVEMRKTSTTSRKYYHDEDFFEEINNEAKAYWLGFIYADGFIESKRKNGSQKLGITLSVVDKAHLYKFKRDIKATNPILDYKGSGYSPENTFSKILITSQKTVSDIRSKGVLENKTHILQFPSSNIVPKELLHHFMRGYFDGDGSLSKYGLKPYYEMNIIGTQDFLNAYQKALGKNLKLGTKDDITFQLHIGGNQQLKRILNFLYQDATVYLDRKHKKYQGLLKCTER